MNDDAVSGALAVLDAHIQALNARDAQALAATLHFPHYRLSGVHLKIWQSPDCYFDDFVARAGAQWSHSSFDDISVLRASMDKVHLDVRIRRSRSDGSQITNFRSLWVVTKVGGVWAASFRSSFAQK